MKTVAAFSIDEQLNTQFSELCGLKAINKSAIVEKMISKFVHEGNI